VGSPQASVEATCLAGLALAIFDTSRAGQLLLRTQRRDGAWPAFVGDPEASWTTALAVSTLNALNESSSSRERAVAWILKTRGREGHWLWRWKFKNSDRKVHFDPDRFGWPWVLTRIVG
jgi:squalene cyclase